MANRSSEPHQSLSIDLGDFIPYIPFSSASQYTERINRSYFDLKVDRSSQVPAAATATLLVSGTTGYTELRPMPRRKQAYQCTVEKSIDTSSSIGFFPLLFGQLGTAALTLTKRCLCEVARHPGSTDACLQFSGWVPICTWMVRVHWNKQRARDRSAAPWAFPRQELRLCSIFTESWDVSRLCAAFTLYYSPQDKGQIRRQCAPGDAIICDKYLYDFSIEH